MEMKQECYDCHSLENIVLAERKISDGKVSPWNGAELGGAVVQTTMLCPACMEGATEVSHEDTH